MCMCPAPQVLASEGDLRFSLVRIREAAEAIAFYKGQDAEQQVVRLDSAVCMKQLQMTLL